MWNSPKTSHHHEVKFQKKNSEDQKVSILQSNSDQQITKNAMKQNDIFDENSIRNADIIFENNDSMPKLSRQNNITQQVRKFKKVQAKKLVKSNKSEFFFVKLHFWQY